MKVVHTYKKMTWNNAMDYANAQDMWIPNDDLCKELGLDGCWTSTPTLNKKEKRFVILTEDYKVAEKPTIVKTDLLMRWDNANEYAKEKGLSIPTLKFCKDNGLKNCWTTNERKEVANQIMALNNNGLVIAMDKAFGHLLVTLVEEQKPSPSNHMQDALFYSHGALRTGQTTTESPYPENEVELDHSKWFICTISGHMFMYQDANKAYGIGSSGLWFDGMDVTKIHTISHRLATNEEALIALTKVAERLGIVAGSKLKSVNSHDLEMNPKTNIYKLFNEGSILEIDGYIVMKYGVWAEVVKEPNTLNYPPIQFNIEDLGLGPLENSNMISNHNLKIDWSTYDTVNKRVFGTVESDEPCETKKALMQDSPIELYPSQEVMIRALFDKYVKD